MSSKTLNFEIDGENSVTVKLSDSGSISLSDITEATIGNLGDGQWNTTIATSESLDPSLTVLRPWESTSASTKCMSSQQTSEINQTTNSVSNPSVCVSDFTLKQPPSYQDHVKRKLDDFQSNQNSGHFKRQKFQEHTQPNIHYRQSYAEQKENNQTNNYQPQFNYPALTQSVDFNSQPKSHSNYTTQVKPAVPQIPKQEAPSEYQYNYNQSQPMQKQEVQNWMTTEYQSIFPQKQTKNHHQQTTPYNTSIVPSNQFIPKLPSQPTTNYSYVQNSVNIPTLTEMSNITTHQQMTPVAKKPLTLTDSKTVYDSPGVDTRFNDSLTNLLGSPLPDSPFSNNPCFNDLKALLTTECKREIVPKTLFTVPDKIETKQEMENVFTRERNLQEQFDQLQARHPEEIRQLSSFFRYQSAMIETERFRTLHECQYPGSYKESVKNHYDNQLHQVMDRVEKSVNLLEKSNKENMPSKVSKPRPHLSKHAVKLMENWYAQNKEHPYPTSTTYELLSHTGNIGVEQVKKWFANKRNRTANTRTLTEIAMQKRKLGQICNGN